jgi:serine/threonine protein kinase
MTDPGYPDALPAQSRLHWYVIERVLGQGGFGITYLARDSNLDQPVAIKEYLPVDVATRRPDATIRARTEENRERYRWGLERFIQEARMLARFDHPNIVRVHSVFELNNTAYMVMRFEAGENLARALESRGALAEDELLHILLPVLDGLALVHEAGFIHRDIKPDNIHIRADGSPVLLDFGSARSALGKAHTLTILVAPGYAPFEQYYSSSESQGPWTDIYSLGATAYRAIAGRAPLDAIARSKGILGSTRDVMVPASVVGAGRYSGRLLAAIDHALAFSEKERPQTVAEWRKELAGEPARVATVRTEPSATRATAAAAAAPLSPAPAAIARARGEAPWWSGARGPVVWSIAGAAVALVAIGMLLHRPPKEQREPQVTAQAPTTDPAADVREKVSALEKQLAEERQRAEAERRQREAEAEARKKQEAAEAERRRQDAEAKAAAAARVPEKKPAAKSDAPRAPAPPVAAARPAPPAPLKPEPPAVAAAPPPEPPTPAQQLAAAERALARGNYAEGADLLKPLAERGGARAQYLLATLLLAGQGVARNEQEALRLLGRAAEQGLAAAQTALGDAYASGRGVARDDQAARDWYQKAAAQGDAEAQTRLGDMFASGRGVPQNAFQAYVWYGIAARSGSAAAREKQARTAPQLQPAEVQQADRLIDSQASGARPR